MYKEPDKWAMTFQNYVTLTMLKNHISKTDKSVKLMERSMYSARYCFVEKMLTSGMIHDGTYHVLLKKNLITLFTIKIHLIIRHVSCFARMV
jgi:deoxynucleoside kinase